MLEVGTCFKPAFGHKRVGILEVRVTQVVCRCAVRDRRLSVVSVLTTDYCQRTYSLWYGVAMDGIVRIRCDPWLSMYCSKAET